MKMYYLCIEIKGLMQSLRNDIIKTAESAFVKFGIRSVSVEDLCESLHISKKTFYNEFSQKDALVEQVLYSFSDCNRKQDEAFMQQFPQGNAIDQAMSYRLPVVKERRKRNQKFMYDLKKYYPEIHQRFLRSKQDDFIALFRSNLISGVEQGYFRKELLDNLDFFARRVYLWMFVESEELMPLKEDQQAQEETLALITDMYMYMVCSPAGLRYYEENYKIKNKV